jgi:HK97 gp10 family phage protein
MEKVLGLSELKQVLERLPQNVQRKVLSGAVRRGANSIRKDVLTRVPVGKEEPHPKYGRLKDNIRVIRMKGATRTEARFSVTIGRAYWGKFLEWGTSRQTATPFMRPAFDEKADQALQGVAETMAKGVLREVNNLVSGRVKGRRRK